MNLSLTLASCSLLSLSTLLLVAPAFADEPPPPAAATAAPTSLPPAYPGPGYTIPPAPGPGMMYGPPMYAPYAPQPMLEQHRASPGLIVGGSILTFAGLGATVGGAFAYLIETGVVCDGSGFDGTGRCGGTGASGIALMVGGSLAVVGGVTMIVFGARKVSTPRSEATLQLRPTGADLRVTF
ncbi:MAG: hypothetical protein ABJE95_17055 [Byssovorax sp.]